MTAREEVLGRIRSALGDRPAAPPIPRECLRGGVHSPGSPELALQLVDRLEDYRATVVRVGAADDGDIGRAVGDALASREIGQAVTPRGTPREWTGWLADVVVDEGQLSARDLDAIPAVVTGAVVAIAETGTIVLDGGPLCGRRAITLVPDTHVCVVRARDIVQTVPEALARLDPQRPLTFVSGPSATSDIELDRVEGVHGPRTLVVVVVG
ncbi:LutC/YkgG family protein [Pedococcus sp. 5OH_020]|uniref:LutC/YkgG family protein n=1 Tax=Pedococcus sp. 5OH_020 TaxID=2989814 RepID=UPI0022E9CD86|nr:LUD domain-containing protein [Pedococcus sp. 5OH_020]